MACLERKREVVGLGALERHAARAKPLVRGQREEVHELVGERDLVEERGRLRVLGAEPGSTSAITRSSA